MYYCDYRGYYFWGFFFLQFPWKKWGVLLLVGKCVAFEYVRNYCLSLALSEGTQGLSRLAFSVFSGALLSGGFKPRSSRLQRQRFLWIEGERSCIFSLNSCLKQCHSGSLLHVCLECWSAMSLTIIHHLLIICSHSCTLRHGSSVVELGRTLEGCAVHAARRSLVIPSARHYQEP